MFTKSLNPSLLTDHVHDIPKAEQAGSVALARRDLQVARHAAAVGLRALERGLDQAVGHRVVPVVRIGQELQAVC